MDVDAFSTEPGTPVICYTQKRCYTQKDPPADNQLWTKESAKDVNSDENAFYLVSKLNPSCKITIQVTISLVHSTLTAIF